ncbi:hypothetical protein TSUD_349020 [Trifolium subterraneum]|uniref:Uncharacterized protein n=1 Tax=Trifolium subterraneum TaxID=3900 RepID=A0A2Z6NY01_TRISU|nr:hypothetical protein TSUD_349020 [Trifolium subterraneum]
MVPPPKKRHFVATMATLRPISNRRRCLLALVGLRRRWDQLQETDTSFHKTPPSFHTMISNETPPSFHTVISNETPPPFHTVISNETSPPFHTEISIETPTSFHTVISNETSPPFHPRSYH